MSRMYKIIHYLLHPTHIFKEMKLNESSTDS